MRMALRPRYYCDHCKKAGGSAAHMVKHEKGCTNNPERVCGLCRHADLIQKPMADLMAAWKTSFKALAEAAGNCPACMLAAQRLCVGPEPSGMWGGGDPRYEGASEWDFKTELASFWKEQNDHRADDRGY